MFKIKSERTLYIVAGCVCVGLGLATTIGVKKFIKYISVKENK